MNGETYYPRHSELDTQADRELDAAQERVRELEAQIRTVAERQREALRVALAERDEARAEVERLERLFQQTHGVHHTWVDARHKVAEAQREACAKQFEGEGASVSDRGNAKWVRATPLVTEGDK